MNEVENEAVWLMSISRGALTIETVCRKVVTKRNFYYRKAYSCIEKVLVALILVWRIDDSCCWVASLTVLGSRWGEIADGSMYKAEVLLLPSSIQSRRLLISVFIDI